MRSSALLLACLLAASPAAAAPKLLVVVSVDQMRADYLDRFAGEYKGGFKTLREKASWFANAAHDHIPTETGPGHAAILTGKTPADTGIIGNEWYDRRLSTNVYCVFDSVHGLGPEHLLAYTLGDALKAKDPASKVVSISIKDRAAILLGGKRPDTALWYDKKNFGFTTSSYYARPAWLDDFNKDAKTDIYTSDADRKVLALAQRVLKEFALGQDAHTDILAISFSATDYIGHKYGSESAEMHAHLLALDGMLGELMAALDTAAGPGGWDLALTADHGSTPLVESPTGKKRGIRRVLYDELDVSFEKALQARFPASEPWVVNDYPNLYLNRAQAAAKGLEWSTFKRQAAETLRKAPDVAQVYVDDAVDTSDPYAKVYARSIRLGLSGDLLVRMAPNIYVTDRPTGADHGSPYEDDARVPMMFYGPDFLPGKMTTPARLVDFAPKLAWVLGVPFPRPTP